jgi:hypothetical protein
MDGGGAGTAIQCSRESGSESAAFDGVDADDDDGGGDADSSSSP